MRIVNWNIEWMNDWFVGRNLVQLRWDNPRKGITDVKNLCERVASVIKALDPDVLNVQEGPSDIREMMLFSDTFLLDAQNQPIFDVFGGIDGGAQKLYALVKRGGKLTNPDIPDDELTEELAEPWDADVNGDLQIEGYGFTRLPLVIKGTMPDGSAITILSLHTKSKYVHRGKELWENLEKRPQFIYEAVKNRRRISTEAMKVRDYLDNLLDLENDQAQIVVTGDFNDGPGMDYFERIYLSHNTTDILVGSAFRPNKLLRHAFLSTTVAADCYTAIFDDFVNNIPNRPLLLDHILLSQSLSGKANGGIAHNEYNDAVIAGDSSRQNYPSDHKPVFVDI